MREGWGSNVCKHTHETEIQKLGECSEGTSRKGEAGLKMQAYNLRTTWCVHPENRGNQCLLRTCPRFYSRDDHMERAPSCVHRRKKQPKQRDKK